MAIYTPNNLKIRLDGDALEPVIFPLKALGEYDNILLDLELWEMLPNAISSVVAIITAYITQSWVNTLLYSLIGYYIGVVIQEFTYSDFLKNLLPMFFGSWMIAVPACLVVQFILIKQGVVLPALFMGLIVFGNWLKYTDFLLLFPIPLSFIINRFIVIAVGKENYLGTVERAFVRICNKRAIKHGLELNWNLYNPYNQDITM